MSNERKVVRERPYMVRSQMGERSNRRFHPLRWLVAVVIAVVIWQLARQFNLKTVTVAGAQSVSTSAIARSARQLASHGPLPANLLWLSTQSVSAGLLATYPSLESVHARLQWPHTLTLEIKERRTALYWQSGGSTYVLDAKGVAIEQATLPVGAVAVVDSTNLAVKLKQAVVPPAFVSFVQGLTTKLTLRTGLKLTNLTVGASTSEVEARVGQGYALKLDASRGVDDELGDLKLVLTQLQKLGQTPAQYIDMRVAGRAYYK